MTLRRGSSDHPHGYVRYTYGCRCDECKAAKAAYVRQRRADARALAADHTDPMPRWLKPGQSFRRFTVSGIKHATSYAYYERGCRCLDCTRWASADALARQQRKRAKTTTS